MTEFVAACVQVNAGPEIVPNLQAAGDLVRRARDRGADLITLPENVTAIVQGRDRILARARSEEDHPGLPYFADLARETGAHLLVGSLTIALGDGRVANRSYVIGPDGTILSRYDKIHLFDVDLPGGESYRESASVRGGDAAVLAPLPWTVLGLSVCYDVRFASLYRTLAQAGAEILAVPAAFTRPTGEAHWHVLLRARAIETGSFVIAPAQTGQHDQGRRTFGHSLIVDPWGEILADAEEEVGVISATIDLDRVTEARAAVPSLRHDRPFRPPPAQSLRQAGE
ncbi:MAG: carbon-nitrogen hydrolase family protein [Inquilinaceae bacterium]